MEGSEGEPKYQATFLIPKNSADIPEILTCMRVAAERKWGAEWEKIYNKLSPERVALKDGDINKPDVDGYAGCMYVTAKSKFRAVVIDVDKSDLLEDSGRPYAGCYVNASIGFYAYGPKPYVGVSADLLGVQFVKDGDAFGAAPRSVDDFDDISDAGTVHDFV